MEVVEVPAKKITVSKTIMNSASKKANASIPVKKSLSTPKPTIKKSLSTPKPTVVSTKKCTPAKKITAVKKPSTVKQTIASKKPAFSKQTIASAKKSAIAKKTTSSAKKVTLAKTNTKVKANTKEIEGTPPGTAKKYTKAEKMAIKQRVKADSVVQKQMMEERIAEAAKAESDDSGFYYSEQRTPTPTKAPSRTSTRRSTRCRK